MKWVKRVSVLLLLLVGAIVAALVWTAQRTPHPVGFQIGQARDSDGRAFPVGIWYPTAAHPSLRFIGAGFMDIARDAPVAGTALPLVMISHGNSGAWTSHSDLALALASAGYIVAAPMHAGDNYADHAAEGTVPWLSGRSRQMHLTLDFMLAQWRDHGAIDPQRIGAFGFSAGGLTVLTSIGATPDLRLVAAHCATTPEFICEMFKKYKAPLLQPALAQAGNTFSPDARIKAAVLAAPGLGFTLAPDAFAKVRVPVQLWSGEQDRIVPYAGNIAGIRQGLGAAAEFHAVPGAGHYSFLAPCGLLAPPVLCSEEGGLDRKAFHVLMNASVIAFFNDKLKRH
jgi:predicted dienelactone hydrolase